MPKPSLIAALQIMMEAYRADRDSARDPQTKERLNRRVVGYRDQLRGLGAVA